MSLQTPAAPYEHQASLVNQVDADDLDGGIAAMLAEGVDSAISRFRPSLAQGIKPEVELALRAFTTAVGILGPQVASPGAELQNLRLHSSRRPGRPARTTLLLYLVLNPPLLPSYILTRARATALSRQWPDLPPHDIRRKLWTLIVRAENLARAWELAGWAWFLWDRRYPNLLMRILGLRLVPSQPHLARMVSYEFMNRQLVWSVMTDFLMFAIPRMPTLPRYMSPTALIKPVTAFFSPPAVDYTALAVAQEATHSAKQRGEAAPASAHSGIVAGIPASTCPVCYLRRATTSVELPGTDIALPRISSSGEGDGEAEDDEDRIFIPAQTDCWGGCKYCYYCVADELAQFERTQRESGLIPPPSAETGSIDEEGTPAKSDRKPASAYEKWTCLRCGGGVTRATRVQPPPLPPTTRSDSSSSVPVLGASTASLSSAGLSDVVTSGSEGWSSGSP